MKKMDDQTDHDTSNKIHYMHNAMFRGVQYVYWVMHKCIMVKVGGKRNKHKICKKQVKFSKTGGKFFKVGGNNNFCKTGGKCTETGKIGGNSKFVVDDKKKSSEISADENQEFFRE